MRHFINASIRKLSVLGLSACVLMPVHGEEGAASTAEGEMAVINLTVSNIGSAEGWLYVSVYDSKETFLGEERFHGQKVELATMEQGQVEVSLTLPYGSYAISVFHDENSNGELDSNFMGLPKEPVGLSNGHVPRFGPPRYKKALLEIDTPQVAEAIALID